eukprot:c6330_g1_i1.p1 GENE.c6330_g1_i1~~c6330_g1_i1.p1  ORF type:complete len:629 (+),score=132.42 c6330_g1_i1:71-1888(+)
MATCVKDLSETITDYTDSGFQFVCTPLFHPRYRHREGLNTEPVTRSDAVLYSSTWSKCVVGLISDWINVETTDEKCQKRAEAAFTQEFKWGVHLAVPAIVIPTLPANPTQLGSLLSNLLPTVNYSELWVTIPLSPKATSVPDSPSTDAWKDWNILRSLLESHPLLGIALEITEDLPEDSELNRWIGEPIKSVILPTSVFMSTRDGKPCLSQRHSKLVNRLMDFPKIHWIIKGRADASDTIPYLHALKHIASKRKVLTEHEQLELTYSDFLQSPLQPLKDNLESQTYETFEKDPVKYVQYENAVFEAILDKTKGISGTTSTQPLVVMVLGAGRGPLVRASLNAAKRANQSIRMYAVEKNPNAVCTLLNAHKTLGWGETVTIVHTDMRVWRAPEKADIIVSELLGSFGDNELSPECLDGANSFLKPDAISIPVRYDSFLAPVSAHKLWCDVHTFKTLQAFETPYVVKMHNVFVPVESQLCFSFVHPNFSNEEGHNERRTSLRFRIPTTTTVHGLVGYFDCTLYKNIHISILPRTFSKGMFSWFPIYFPLRTPVTVQGAADDTSIGSNFEVKMWRRCSTSKVWYEWCIVDPVVSPIHNPGGRSYHVGL